MRNKRSTLLKAYAPPGAKEATVFLIHRPMFAMTSISRQSLRRSGYFLVDGHVYVLGLYTPFVRATPVMRYRMSIYGCRHFVTVRVHCGWQSDIISIQEVWFNVIHSMRYRRGACGDRSLSWRQLCRLIRLHGQKKWVEAAICFTDKRKYGLTSTKIPTWIVY